MRVNFGIQNHDVAMEGLLSSIASIIKESITALKWHGESDVHEIKSNFQKELESCKKSGKDPNDRFTVEFSETNLLQYDTINKIKPVDLRKISRMYGSIYGVYSDFLYKIRSGSIDTSSDKFDQMFTSAQTSILEEHESYKSDIVSNVSDMRDVLSDGISDVTELQYAGYTNDAHDRMAFEKCGVLGKTITYDVHALSDIADMTKEFSVTGDTKLGDKDKSIVTRMGTLLQSVKRDYEVSIKSVIAFQSALVKVMNKDYSCLCSL